MYSMLDKILNKINLIGGVIVTILSYIFGQHWYLFLAFLVLNVVDYVTGILKAKYFNIENSQKGLKGIIKKVGYWVVIGIAFFMSICFGEIGGEIGLNLGITQAFGWFTLATFIINEIRSTLENLIAMDVYIPPIFIKGMEAANKVIDDEDADEEQNDIEEEQIN